MNATNRMKMSYRVTKPLICVFALTMTLGVNAEFVSLLDVDFNDQSSTGPGTDPTTSLASENPLTGPTAVNDHVAPSDVYVADGGTLGFGSKYLAVYSDDNTHKPVANFGLDDASRSAYLDTSLIVFQWEASAAQLGYKGAYMTFYMNTSIAGGNGSGNHTVAQVYFADNNRIYYSENGGTVKNSGVFYSTNTPVTIQMHLDLNNGTMQPVIDGSVLPAFAITDFDEGDLFRWLSFGSIQTTSSGPATFGLDNLTAVWGVPEPASLVLLLVGMVGSCALTMLNRTTALSANGRGLRVRCTRRSPT